MNIINVPLFLKFKLEYYKIFVDWPPEFKGAVSRLEWGCGDIKMWCSEGS